MGEAERVAAEAKAAERAERHRAKRAEREAREATHTDGEPLTEGPERMKRSDRRKSHMDGPLNEDDERRRRREERRAARGVETPKTSRRKSAPIVDSYFDSRNGSKARETEKDSRRKKAGWPHSGTDSWVGICHRSQGVQVLLSASVERRGQTWLVGSVYRWWFDDYIYPISF